MWLGRCYRWICEHFSAGLRNLRSPHSTGSRNQERRLKERSRETGAHDVRTLFTALIHCSAFVCSILHFILFNQLHGRPAEGDGAPMSQSMATATSIILSTLFRATLLGSIGMCYAQYVWRMLRDQAIPVHIIEGLFQLRSNPTELANVWFLKHGLLLFGIALYM